MQGARWQGRCSRLAERIPGQRLPAEGSPASSPRLRSRGRQLRCQEWRRSRLVVVFPRRLRCPLSASLCGNAAFNRSCQNSRAGFLTADRYL